MTDSYPDNVYATYNADTYAARNDLSEEGLARSARMYERHFGPYLPEDRSLPILEIGCGVGAFLTCLESMGYAYRGIDISEDQIAFCRARGLEDVEVADGLSYLERSREFFGAVVLSDVLEHLDKARALATLGAIARRLAPEGRLLLRVPNLSNPLNVRTRYVDFTHELGFSQESLAQVLRLSGFKVLSVHGEYALHRRRLARWVFDGLAWRAFQLLYRHTLHLKAEIVRGKNLIAVATPARRES